MAFPITSSAEGVVQIYIDGAWVDITSDGRHDAGIGISRGRRDEQSRVSPSRCDLTLHNTTGKYSPRNPNSVYFGKLGQNTELRVLVDGVNEVLDTFTRTETNGWGTADNGLVWNPENVADSYYSTNGTVGQHSVAALNESRFIFLDAGVRDPDLTVTVSAPVLATGAPIRAGLVIRGTEVDPAPATTNQYTAWLEMRTDQTMYLEMTKTVASAVTVLGTDTTTGLTHAAGTQYKVRFQANGTALKAKCWLAASAEPAAWNLEVTDTSLTTGSYGCRSRLDTGNTNTLPVAISFDNLEARNVRFHGEMSLAAPKWDVSEADVYVPVEASGILRRLGQGASPLRSALYRSRIANPRVAYWPMEDGSGATSFAEAFGRGAMTLNANVSPGTADQIGLESSAPLAVLNTGARCVGSVTDPVAATEWSVQFMLKVAYAATPDTALCEWYTDGNPGTWRLTLTAGDPPGMKLQCFDAEGAPIAAFELLTLFTAGNGRSLVGEWVAMSITARQDGSNIDYEMTWWADNVLWFSEAADAGTVGAVRAFQFGAPSLGSALDGTSVGHVLIQDVATHVLADFGTLTGTDPEPAGTRLQRLCEEEGVPFQLIGVAADTESMGPQRIATLPDLLNDCAEADGGILYEPRDRLGLAYRTKRSLYNQTAALELDYSLTHLSPPFEPVDDDQAIRNDITVERRGGSSARAVQETGPRNVQDPKDDPQGVGRYDEKVTLDVFADPQCEQIATWRRHLGTWDEYRYPSVGVNLTRSVFTASSALTAAAAGVDVGNYLTAENPPSWLPPDLIDLLAQGLSERLGNKQWSIGWNCTPAGPYQVMGVYDTSRYDTAGCELAEDLTTTETLADVTTTLGPVWADPGAGSFDLNIGGERVTCTNVSGAGAAQTLTLTRSVNGVVKTHSTGAAVSLWRPARYAL